MIPVRAIGIGGALDSLSEIRLKQPLTALQSLEGSYDIQIQRAHFNIDWPAQSGILLTYRLHPQDSKTLQDIDAHCRDGWLWVHDVDDDPRYLGGQKANKFRSIASAHIVTCSTAPLSKICREFNRNVAILPNQITELPPRSSACQRSAKPKVFLGAINRSEEWGEGLANVVSGLQNAGAQIELFVIQDTKFAGQFGEGFPLHHLPILDYVGYLQHIDQMDIALIPLRENEFNRSKSDLKIIEALAHGMVPIVSRFAANMTEVPNDLLFIVDEPEDWGKHLETLIGNPDKLPEIKARGYEYISHARLWRDHAAHLDQIYRGAIKDWARLEDERQLRISIRKTLGLPA